MSSLIGATIEWYDFFLYGVVAGIVFNKLYFPAQRSGGRDPARLHDVRRRLRHPAARRRDLRPLRRRIGRKSVLVMTLMIMGVATFLIGLIPTYAQIGVWAPILLLVMRVLQGIGLGGEWGGAVLMAFEYAPAEQARLLREHPADRAGDRTVPRVRAGGPAVARCPMPVPGLGMARRLPGQRRAGRRRALHPPAHPRDAGVRPVKAAAASRPRSRSST